VPRTQQWTPCDGSIGYGMGGHIPRNDTERDSGRTDRGDWHGAQTTVEPANETTHVTDCQHRV